MPLLRTLVLATALLLPPGMLVAQTDAPKPLRAGMIGLDTSHVPAFAKLFNGPKATGELAGIRIVAGYPGGTDFGPSKTRVAKFTEDLRGMGVEIVDSIPKLLEKVDVVFLESVDGRIHLKEATPVIKAGKPLFIDKPAAGSLADAIAIFDLAAKHKVATPVNWKDGEDVIILGSVTDEDAKKQYPQGWKAPKPYLRIVPQPK